MNCLDLFSASYKRVLIQEHDKKEFFDRFYEIFCSQSEEIARLFENTHMSSQKTMLHDSLDCLVDFFVSSKAPSYLKNVARRHSQADLDISLDLYDVWLDSLVFTVREYDPQFDADVERAWRTTLSPGIAYMKHYHDE